MKVAIFPGCVVATEQYAYELSAREVLPRLGVELTEVDGFSCCGWPMQSVNTTAWLYLSARNLALAEKEGVGMLTLCNVCNRSLHEAREVLQKNKGLRNDVSSLLAEEGLSFNGGAKVWHMLELLHEAVGLDKIREIVKKPLENLKLAAHIGCQALRPSELRRIDDPENPQKLDGLIRTLGAESPHYPEKLDCCGALLLFTKRDAALTLTGEKIEAIQNRGFDGLVTLCSQCQRMLDARQAAAATAVGKPLSLPVLYCTQLLGLAIGADQEKLGLKLNASPVGELIKKFES